MEPIGFIRTLNETYDLYENGNVGRPAIGMLPSGKWSITGAIRCNNFGNEVERFSFEDILAGRVTGWRHKNGKARIHILDLDHGTARLWCRWAVVHIFRKVPA